MTGLIGPDGLSPAAVAGAVGDAGGWEWLAEPALGARVLGASIDTRELEPGQAFFALRGERVDGHDYLAAAAERGCPLAIVERGDVSAPGEMGVLRVDDGPRAMAALARAYRRALGLRVVGVTGSNGKTTTVRLIHSALRAGGLRGTRSAKSHNNHLGVPLTLLNARPGDGFVVCEIGMSARGEIAALAAVAEPDIAVITSIGVAHIEALGSRRAIAEEKADLVRSLRPGGLGVVCGGVDLLDEVLAGFNTAEVVRVGEADGCDARLDGFELGPGGASCGVTMRSGGEPGSVRVATRLPGRHNAQNAAIAYVVARRMGVSPGDAARGVLEAEPPPMRLERLTLASSGGPPGASPGGPVALINDAYNANPDSMRATLGMFAQGLLDGESGRPRRRVAVIGEMLELGAISAEAHGEVARMLAESVGINAVVLIGGQAGAMRDVIDRARPGAVLVAVDEAKSDWPVRVAALIEPGDLVLLKGSRGVRLERLLETLDQTMPGRGPV